MPWWRKLLLAILSPLFITLLFATAFDVGFSRVVTHPATVKKLAADSGIYNSVVTSLLDQTKVIQTPLGDIGTSDPAIQAAANKALSPQAVQAQGNAAIDSIYQWLDGKTDQPSFTLGLGANAPAAAASIADTVQQKLAALPACTASQDLAILRSGTFDALNATCLPRGISPSVVAAGLKQSLIANQDFLQSVSINASDIKSGNSGQSFFQQSAAKSIPKQYQRAKKIPMVLIALTILTGLGIVFLSRTWRHGLRHIGINLLIIGLLMLALSWGLNRLVSTNIAPKIKLDNAVLQQDIRNLVTDIAKQIGNNYRLFGLVYAVAGTAAIAGGQIAIKRNVRSSPLDKVKIDLAPHPSGKPRV